MPQGKKPSQIDQIVADASARFLDEEADRQRVPREFARKIASIESSGRADVISGQRRSSAGAIGKMQLMPGTARDLGVDPNHLEQNVQGGVKYLRQQLDAFGGNQRKAAAAYNAGTAAVRKYGGVPPYAETQKYANQFPSGGESDIDRIVRGVSAQTPVSTASESEPSTLRKVSATGRQKTTVRGPVTPRLPSPFALNQPTGFEQAGQQVSALTSQISPEVAAQVDQRAARIEAERQRYNQKGVIGRRLEDVGEGLAGVGESAQRGFQNLTYPVRKGLSAVSPTIAARLKAGEEAQAHTAQRIGERAQAADSLASKTTRALTSGVVGATTMIPLARMGGIPAVMAAIGIQQDWSDPKAAALTTALAGLPIAAGKAISPAAARIAGRSFTAPVAQEVIRRGIEAGAGGVTNVGQYAGTQALLGRPIDPEEALAQGVAGGVLGTAMAPGRRQAASMGRAQSPIDVPVYDDTGEITGYDRINAPLTPDVVGQGVHRAGDLGATVQRAGDIRPRPRGTSPMPIQSRLAELTPPPNAPATTAMPPPDTTQIPAQPASNPLAILNANANEAKINAAQFEAAGDWESARREYDVAHKTLVAAQRQMGRPKTGEEADALTAVQREISAAAANRDRARRSMMAAGRAESAAGRAAARQQRAVEDAPTTDFPAETSPLLKSVVNPEGGIPDAAPESPSGLFGQLGRQQAVEQAKPQRGPKDSGQLSAAEYLKRATDGEGVRVSDRGEARILGAKEAGIVGLTNRASKYAVSDAQVMLDEGGFSLPDGRKFTDPSVTENDVLAFLAESGREGRMNTRDLDQRIEQEAADYYANQPTGDLPERTAPLTEGVSRGMGAFRPSQELDYRPRQIRPPAPDRPVGRFQRESIEGIRGPATMSAAYPRAKRALFAEGRRVQTDVEASQSGQFGKLAESMFKSNAPGVLHGHDAFFHDGEVKAAVGLTRDAEQGEVRSALKVELARVMGIESGDVSLKQIPPQAWRDWVSLKQLGPQVKAKLESAIGRFEGKTDAQTTVTPRQRGQSNNPQNEPVRAPEVPGYRRFVEANRTAIDKLHAIGADEVRTPGGQRRFNAIESRLRANAQQMGVDRKHVDSIVTDAMNAQADSARRADARTVSYPDPAIKTSEPTSIVRSRETPGQKIPALSDAVKAKIDAAAIDRENLSVDRLGLERQPQVTFQGRTKRVRTEIDLDDISLNRDSLNRDRLTRLESDLAEGVKRQRVFNIEVNPDPRNPGKYIVGNDGNHRIAYMKLAGQKENVEVDVVMDARAAVRETVTAPRTVSHPDPAIDGKPILAETADGRVIVPNEENKSGVSVVKPDRKPIKYAIPEEAMPELRSNRERGAKTRDQSPLIDMVQVRDVKKRLDQLDKQIEKLEEFYDDDDPQLNRGVSQLEHQINQSIAPLLSDLEVQRNTITGKIRQLDDAYDEVVHKIQEIKGRDRGNEREHMRKRADDALAAFSKQLKEIDSRRGQLETSEDKLRDIVDAMEERIVITETPEIERLTKEHDQLWQMWAASKEGTTERKTALSKLDEIGERLSAAIDAKRVLALGNRERGAKTRADVENSPEFKKWFGDSKVVDDEGKPMVVYHGTWRDYDAFNADAAQDASRSAESAFGFHFGTSGQAESRIYRGEGKSLTRTDITRNMGRADSRNRAKTMPVYLQLRNPLRMEDAGAWEGRPLIKALNDAGVYGDFAERSPREIARMIRDMGYDGIVYQNVGEMDLDANGNFKDSYIAFRPEQIKSATGNRGTFDPNDANITRQRGNQPPPMPDRVTARDLADNIRAEYRPAANRPGTVYLNDWGLEALNAADYLEFRAVREGAADDRITGGMNYPPEEARQIADHIRERAGRPNFSDEGRKNLETMARQIELAADDGNVSFVPMKGQALGQAKVTVRHEAFHSQQSAIHPDVHELTTPRWLRAQKFGAAIGEELSWRGYSERQHPAEAAAFMASEGWMDAKGKRKDHNMFGMTFDEVKTFLTDYFDNVAYRHGKEVINKFRAIHPALQEIVEARRGTNEPRFGSPGLGRGAESAVNRQRGVERPGGSVARSRGSVPGGDAGSVRGQSQTADLRAITPESLRAGQQAQPSTTQGQQRQGLAGIRAEDLRAESGAGGNGIRPPRAGRRSSEPEEPNADYGPKDTDKPAGFWSKLSDVRKAGLLSGPKTHIVNMLGNTAYQVTEEVSRIPAGIMDMALSAATGRRSVAGANPMAVARASRKAATDGIREAVQIMKTGIPKETAAKLQLKESKFTNPILKGYTQFVFRALGAEDQIFKTYALTRSLESQAKAMALNDRRAGKIGRGDVKARMEAYRDNPTNEMSANAIADAEVATFQNDNKLSSALRAGRGQIGEFGNFAVDLFLPFDRTPTNIIARTLEMTPLGFGKTAKQLAEAIGKKSFDEKQQRAFAQTFGRASTGSALIYLGYALAAQGVMTGLADPDPRKRAKQEAIAPPAAIKINGRWFQVGKFAPAGVLMGLGATIHRDAKAGKGVGDVALSTATGMGRIALEQPMLKAGKEIADLSRAQTIPGKTGRMVGSFIPTIVDNVGTLTDPYQRDTKTFLGGLGSRIPGVRRLLPVRKDARGRPIKTEKTDVIDPFSSRPARP